MRHLDLVFWRSSFLGLSSLHSFTLPPAPLGERAPNLVLKRKPRGPDSDFKVITRSFSSCEVQGTRRAHSQLNPSVCVPRPRTGFPAVKPPVLSLLHADTTRLEDPLGATSEQHTYSWAPRHSPASERPRKRHRGSDCLEIQTTRL